MIVPVQTMTGHELDAYVTPDGKHRLLAALPDKGLAKAAPYGAANPIYDRKDWVEFDRRETVVPILDQSNIGSCNAHGAASTVMKARAKGGQRFVLLSASSLYALINGGVDQGSAPDDAANALVDFGICLDAQVPEGFYVERQVRGFAATAARFRIEPGAIYRGSSFDELASAILDGFDCWFTVRVAGDWTHLGPESIPPAYRGYGNHVTSDDDALVKLKDGRWAVRSRNSWGLGFGDEGRYHFVEDHAALQPGFVFYAVKYADWDAADPDPVPPVA